MPQKNTKSVIATEVAHKVRCLCPKCGKNMTVSQEMVLEIVNTFIVEMALAMREDTSMQMRGFGTFRVADKSTKGWNPKTQKQFTLPPAKTVRFKISQSFVDIATGKDDPYADMNPDLKMVAPHPDVAANFDAQTEGE